MKSTILALMAAVALVACGKAEQKPETTVKNPVVDSQNQPVKTDAAVSVVTEAPAEKKEEVKK